MRRDTETQWWSKDWEELCKQEGGGGALNRASGDVGCVETTFDVESIGTSRPTLER